VSSCIVTLQDELFLDTGVAKLADFGLSKTIASLAPLLDTGPLQQPGMPDTIAKLPEDSGHGVDPQRQLSTASSASQERAAKGEGSGSAHQPKQVPLLARDDSSPVATRHKIVPLVAPVARDDISPVATAAAQGSPGSIMSDNDEEGGYQDKLRRQAGSPGETLSSEIPAGIPVLEGGASLGGFQDHLRG
jgi:hypothetical protein